MCARRTTTGAIFIVFGLQRQVLERERWRTGGSTGPRRWIGRILMVSRMRRGHLGGHIHWDIAGRWGVLRRTRRFAGHGFGGGRAGVGLRGLLLERFGRHRGQVGFPVVSLHHANSPFLQVDGGALRCLQEGILVLIQVLAEGIHRGEKFRSIAHIVLEGSVAPRASSTSISPRTHAIWAGTHRSWVAWEQAHARSAAEDPKSP